MDTDVPADRQGHEGAQLLVSAHAQVASHPPETDEYAEHATCINRRAQNQSRHPQLHPLLKGNTGSLCIYDIPSSAFLLLPQNLFFAALEGFLFCLLAGALSAHEKNKLEPSSKERAHFNLIYDFV